MDSEKRKTTSNFSQHNEEWNFLINLDWNVIEIETVDRPLFQTQERLIMFVVGKTGYGEFVVKSSGFGKIHFITFSYLTSPMHLDSLIPKFVLSWLAMRNIKYVLTHILLKWIIDKETISSQVVSQTTGNCFILIFLIWVIDASEKYRT